MIPKKPTNVTWTDEQWEAIYEENKNIIVSAGAGSGKTAVLTERVIRKLKDGVNIDHLLILTFTKAAAGEMADRIRKKIKKIPELKDQLDLLDSAYITTFDSFALSIVKKYHYLLNVSPEIGIIDSSVILLEKVRIMDEIFLSYYEEQNPEFLNLISTFCTKDDKEIKAAILKISNQLDLLSNKKKYLTEYVEQHFQDANLTEQVQEFLAILQEKITSIFTSVDEISRIDAEYATKLQASLELLKDITCYNDFKTNLNIKLPQVPRGSSEELKQQKTTISDTIKEIQQKTPYENEDALLNALKSTYPFVKIIIDIILKFTDKLTLYKQEKEAYEFNDIAIMAIDVVKNNNTVKEELKAFFQEIMIDEYQDTNDLQEEFISMIKNHNVYMVGDIKQSIYRFRNANPYIFKNKYDNYTKSQQGKKIDLNKNFRSRKEVLENINLIFNLIMGESLGGANYLESHQMIFGNESYLKEDPLHSNEMEIIKYPYDKDCGFTKEEIEPFIIARDILSKVENHYLIFDKDKSILRQAQYNDFAIIMDRSTTFDLYKKIFNYLGIPLTLLKNEKMNDEDDLFLINNIIKFILKIAKKERDTEFKYLFISIARSFLFGISDEEIFEIFSKNTDQETEIYQKSFTLVKSLAYTTPHQFIDDIIQTFSFYEKYITIGNIHNGIIKLSKIREIALNLEPLGYSIEDFSLYLSNLLEKGIEMQYEVTDTGANAVRIMTIHKSKGLEYPVCYFSGLYKKFNISDLKDKFLYDKKYGLITPYFQEGIGETILKDLVRDNYLKEEISEKIRLFYVAATRAREKMIFLMPDTETPELNTHPLVLEDSIKKKFRTLEDMLDFITFRLSSYEKKITLESIHLTKEYANLKKSNYQASLPKTTKPIDLYTYSFKEQELTSKKFSKKEEKVISKKEYEHMQIGTKLHEYLEFFDFKHPTLEKIEDKLAQNLIKNLLNHPLFQHLEEATIYQEYEFTEEEAQEERHGIIDLMLVYPDHIDIVDYKLSNLEDPAYIDQLSGYYHYIQKRTHKNTHLYLYSLITNEIKEIHPHS